MEGSRKEDGHFGSSCKWLECLDRSSTPKGSLITEFLSQLRTKLRNWAVMQVTAGCYLNKPSISLGRTVCIPQLDWLQTSICVSVVGLYFFVEASCSPLLSPLPNFLFLACTDGVDGVKSSLPSSKTVGHVHEHTAPQRISSGNLQVDTNI